MEITPPAAEDKSFWILFPGGSDGKDSACNTEDAASIPGYGRSPGESHGQRSLADYSPQGQKGTDTAERLSLLLSSWLVRCSFLWSSRYSVWKIVPSPGFNQLKEKGLLYYQRTAEEKWQFHRSLWMILCSKWLFTASFYSQHGFQDIFNSWRTCLD